MKITQTVANRMKNDISKFDVNLITKPNISMNMERCKFGDITQSKSTLSGSGKFVMTPRAIEIENIRQNIVVSLHNMGEKFVASIGIPKNGAHGKMDTPETIQQGLEAVISDMRSRMKHSYDEIVAVITGGIRFDGNPQGAKSVELLDSIYNTLAIGEKMPTTVLAEQKIDMANEAEKGINMYTFRDMINLFGGIIKDAKGTKPATPEEVEEAANKMFDFVEISKQAPAKILDKEPILVNSSKW